MDPIRASPYRPAAHLSRIERPDTRKHLTACPDHPKKCLHQRGRPHTINALRGHLAEFGIVAPQGRAHVARLALALDEASSDLPAQVHELGTLLLEKIADLDAKIAELEKDIHAHARRDEDAARLMTIPGVGPICAMAIQAFAPPMESFRCGRDFSAWLGLVPRQHSTGGKPRLGSISKMGQRDLRRLLVCGAMAVVRWACRRGETDDPWLGTDAGAQACDGRGGGAGQPHGAHRLGADGEQGGLPGSRRCLSDRRRSGRPETVRAGRRNR